MHRVDQSLSNGLRKESAAPHSGNRPGFRTLVLERVLPDHLQHQEEKGRRTSEGKQPVDRADRAKAPPRFREHDITVTKRRVRNTGEIPAVAKRAK